MAEVALRLAEVMENTADFTLKSESLSGICLRKQLLVDDTELYIHDIILE